MTFLIFHKHDDILDYMDDRLHFSGFLINSLATNQCIFDLRFLIRILHPELSKPLQITHLRGRRSWLRSLISDTLKLFIKRRCQCLNYNEAITKWITFIFLHIHFLRSLRLQPMKMLVLNNGMFLQIGAYHWRIPARVSIRLPKNSSICRFSIPIPKLSLFFVMKRNRKRDKSQRG